MRRQLLTPIQTYRYELSNVTSPPLQLLLLLPLGDPICTTRSCPIITEPTDRLPDVVMAELLSGALLVNPCTDTTPVIVTPVACSVVAVTAADDVMPATAAAPEVDSVASVAEAALRAFDACRCCTVTTPVACMLAAACGRVGRRTG